MDAGAIESFLRNTLHNRSPKVALFVGAGISMDSGLPNFFSFGKHVCQYVTGKFEHANGIEQASVLLDNEVCGIVDKLRPEVLLQALHDEIGDRIFDFYEWLDGDSPNQNHMFLAHAIVQGHIVLTTNIDNLIEVAFEKITGQTLSPIVTAEAFQDLVASDNWIAETDSEQGYGKLLKLHGSIAPSASTPAERFSTIRFLLHQVGHGLTPAMKAVLQRCLRELDIAFLGYSGCDHFSIHPVLRETVSDRMAYWFWFDEKEKFETSPQTFSSQRDAIGRKVTVEGNSFANILRGMELYSTCEILEKRTNCVRWSGHTSHLVARTTGQPAMRLPPKPGPIPAWVPLLSAFEWHMCAGCLYAVAHDVSQSLRFYFIALSIASTTMQRARAHKCIGKNFLVVSTPASYKQAILHLTIAVDMYLSCDPGEVRDYPFPIINARLALVDALRRAKEYPAAKSLLAITQSFTESFASEFSGQGPSESVMKMKDCKSQIHRLYGLTLGMSGNQTSDDVAEAVRHLQESLNIIATTGFVADRASSLNSLGLLYLNSTDVDELMTAEKNLKDAFELNMWTGNARGCFQQLRNLGLVHTKLANMVMNVGIDSILLARPMVTPSPNPQSAATTPPPNPQSAPPTPPPADTDATADAAISQPLVLRAPVPTPALSIEAWKALKRKHLLTEAHKDFRSAIRFLERMPSGSVLGEVLEARFRQGEVLVALGRGVEADGILQDVYIARGKDKDWHNQARTLELLLQTTQNASLLVQWANCIKDIYEKVLQSDSSITMFRNYRIRYHNALAIVNRAIDTISTDSVDPFVPDELKVALNVILNQLSSLQI